MVFGKLFDRYRKIGGVPKTRNQTEVRSHTERLESALYQISSVLHAQNDLNMILKQIIRESVNCLKPTRCTLFIYDPGSEALKVQFSHTVQLLYQRVGVVEEKEVAKKALRERKPLLLAGPESFSNLFKYEERENKITSLMSIPLFGRERNNGVLSAVLINGRSDFDENGLRLFSSFANLVFAAMELTHFYKEAQAGKDFRIAYERYLDNILSQLQSLSSLEQERIQTHIAVVQAEEKAEGPESPGDETKESVPWTQAAILLQGERGSERCNEERTEGLVRVEFEEEYWSFTGNLSRGGAFVLTPNPMDLEDEFSLQIHLPEEREPIKVECKVIWTNKYGRQTKNLRRGMGVKFLSLQSQDQNRIENFIKAYASKTNH